MLKKLTSLFSAGADVVTLGAQGIVVDAASNVLLIRHTYHPGWHFPGGGIEHGETVEDALVREVFEETGAKVTGPPELVGIYSHFDVFPGDHIVLFLVRHWQRDIVPGANTEIAETRFFALDALPEDLSKGTARRLQEVFACAERSSAW